MRKFFRVILKSFIGRRRRLRSAKTIKIYAIKNFEDKENLINFSLELD
jgi:hypothetical protein